MEPKMYMSPDKVLVKFSGEYISMGGMGSLDSDGTKNVRNFNISPLRCTRNPSTDSNTNMNCRECKYGVLRNNNLVFCNRRNNRVEATYLFWDSSAYKPVSDLKEKHQHKSKWQRL